MIPFRIPFFAVDWVPQNRRFSMNSSEGLRARAEPSAHFGRTGHFFLCNITTLWYKNSHQLYIPQCNQYMTRIQIESGSFYAYGGLWPQPNGKANCIPIFLYKCKEVTDREPIACLILRSRVCVSCFINPNILVDPCFSPPCIQRRLCATVCLKGAL